MTEEQQALILWRLGEVDKRMDRLEGDIAGVRRVLTALLLSVIVSTLSFATGVVVLVVQ